MNDRASSVVPLPATCAITAHGMCESRLSTIPALRDGAVPAGAPALPPRFLRHCDEHTVVGLRAVLEAIAATPSVANDLPQHGVIGAPCQAGRLVTARSLIQMRQDGPVAISTHIVPQCSLHSLAGAVSVALGMHGPHLGVGGGPDAFAEGLMTAVSIVHAAGGAASLPAVWLVATEWDEEPSLDAAGQAVNDPVCRGLAMLFDASGLGEVTLDVHGPSAALSRPVAARRRSSPLVDVARAVSSCRTGGSSVTCHISAPWPLEVTIARRSPASLSPPRREAA